MSEPDLLFELLIIAFNAPAQLGEIHQLAEGDIFRKRRKPVFGRLVLTFGPLDQQPLFRPAVGEHVVTMRETNAHASQARGYRLGRPLPPRDRAPGVFRKAESELLDRDRLMLAVAAKALRWSPAARPLFGGSGPASDVHTVVFGKIPAT